MNRELVALLDGRKTGRVVRDQRGKLTFYILRDVAPSSRGLPALDFHAPGSCRTPER
jgi:hypothetical protein